VTFNEIFSLSISNFYSNAIAICLIVEILLLSYRSNFNGLILLK